MKISAQLAAGIFICALGISLSPVSTMGQEQPGKDDYSWLNGRWSGDHALGGKLQMELQVKVGEISGSGTVHDRGKVNNATVTGSAKGDRVTLDLSFPNSTSLRYGCRATEQKTLECAAKKGSKSIFTRMP